MHFLVPRDGREMNMRSRLDDPLALRCGLLPVGWCAFVALSAVVGAGRAGGVFEEEERIKNGR